MLNNLYMKLGNKISTYNVNFIYYISQLCWGNSVLFHCYYQRLPNQIQDSIFTWEQKKLILFQDIYTLAMTIDHCYWEYDYKYHHTRQVKKETLESYFWKQEKTPISDHAIYYKLKTLELVKRVNLVLG